MSFNNHLNEGKAGGNLIFLGAGFSADCLNFKAEEIGSASPLLEFFNEKLEYRYGDLQLAADDYLRKFGEHNLFNILAEKYEVHKRTKVVDQILSYPWSRIYTTNYDAVIEQSLTQLGQRYYSANNTEKPFDVSKHHPSARLVVHLHGALNKWEMKNFLESCVLGRESYLKISSNTNWAQTLREDYARASAVFFVGFSNSDFYLAEHLYSASSSKDKVFFINSESSTGDRELLAKQRSFGSSFSIGKEHFAEEIEKTLRSETAPQLSLHSYVKGRLPEIAPDRASVLEQEAFMIRGQTDGSLLLRDILDISHSYRTTRAACKDIVEFIKTPRSVAMVLGGVCSGKSLILGECEQRLLIEGETVFNLHGKFYDLLEETRKILSSVPNPVIIVDDCFSLRADLKEIIKCASLSGARLLLSSRTLAHDSEEDIRSFYVGDIDYRIFDVEVLNEIEGNELIECTDRIAGWGSQVVGLSQKRRILEKDHSSRLSGFLLGIFQSPHIKSRFLSELEAIRLSGASTERALIVALYLQSVGEPVQEHVLSELIGQDAVSLFERAKSSGTFISYRPRTKSFDVLPSINAREALKQFFLPKTVTDTIVDTVRNMEGVRFQGSFRRIFTEFMRYTQLKQVVSDFDQQDRFFDRLSEIWFCNNQVLFKLQWSMAMRDHQDWGRARQYLEEAYGQARATPGFTTFHLDDQKAGLLLDSISDGAKSSEYLRSFKDFTELLSRSIKAAPVTSHSYQTIGSVSKFGLKLLRVIDPNHKAAFIAFASSLLAVVKKKAESQHEGFIKERMNEAVRILSSFIADVGGS